MEERFDSEEEQENELFEHYNIVADPGQQAMRIDKFLNDRIPNTSRNKLQDAAKSGYIKVNGEVVKPNYKVKPEDVITVELPYPVREIELLPEDIPLNIVYEDDTVIVLNKSDDMVVHPGYGNFTGTLVNGLIHHFDNLPENEQHGVNRPGLVHRLDKNTSGLMVMAKTEEALSNLSKQFFDRKTERRYWALVWGDVTESGTIEGHIGRSLQNRKVMTVFEEGEYGKHAITHYKPIESFGYVTLVECKLETGRTHQIRVHMAHVRYPIIGDPAYGRRGAPGGLTDEQRAMWQRFPRQALHAASLAFDHPSTGEPVSATAPVPDDMQRLIDSLDELR